MRFFRFLLLSPVGVCLILGSSSFAADVDRLASLFRNSFFTGMYETSSCGDNILRLIRAAQGRGIDLSGTYWVKIENYSGQNYGLLRGLRAREAGKKWGNGADPGPMLPEGEVNWYHHVVLVADSTVLDFAFTNEPTVISVRDYVREMFLGPSSRAGWRNQVYMVSGFRASFYDANTFNIPYRGVAPHSVLSFAEWLPELF